MDAHHWCPDADACDQCFTFAFILARIVRNISRRAAHIKADDILDACLSRSLGHPDNASRRSGQHGIFTPEAVAAGETAIGLHEQCRDIGPRFSF